MQQPERVIPASDMLHLKFRVTGKHPLLGVSPLISLAPALQPLFSMREGQSQVWQAISLPGAYLASDTKMNLDQKTSLRESFDSLGNGRPVVLDGGLEMRDVPIPDLARLQMLDLARYGTEEIARAWGVPTSMLSQSEGINYASAAEQSRQFVTVSLHPFAKRVESAVGEKLLSRAERANGFAMNIDLTQMLLGHGQERSEYFSRMLNAGVMTTNEARNQSGLSDVEGGDVVRVPVNTLPLGQWEQGELALEPVEEAALPNITKEPPKLRSVERVSRLLEHVS
jgi:HK97 family phage portal protein